MRHIIAVVIAILSAGSLIGAPKPPELPQSKTLLEQRLQSLLDESKNITLDQADLIKLQTGTALAQQRVSSQPSNREGLNKIKSQLNNAWAAIENAPPEVILDRNHTEYDNLSSAIQEASNTLLNSLNIIRDLQPRTRIGGLIGFDSRPRNTQQENMRPITIGLIDQHITPLYSEMENTSIEELESFIFHFSGEEFKREKLSEEKISSYKQHVANVCTAIDNIGTARSKVSTALSALSTGITQTLENLKVRTTEIESAIAEIDSRLSSGAAATDKQLIIAVYCMIIALVVLFISVRFQDISIATKIIENRSLVEVVSMAFLLLTIIILGTGEKMPKDAIGAVLGSVAGYIFGRKTTN